MREGRILSDLQKGAAQIEHWGIYLNWITGRTRSESMYKISYDSLEIILYHNAEVTTDLVLFAEHLLTYQ